MSRGEFAIPDGGYRHVPGFLATAEADALLAALVPLPDWQRELVRMFGREYRTPRSTAWYGDSGASYRYSGLTRQPLPWPACLEPLRERLRAELGVPFNSVLANLYRDGSDNLGWHSDDERDLGERPVIASISVGATRRFLLRHRTRRDVETIELELAHGSLLVMHGTTQSHWKHRIPKSVSCTAPRVNLTFRRVILQAGG